ncbi:YcxB family protein [Streptomyces uncialis]|uniref:YcxB family protein n=1 Tax=Streptomyces uncialis TaxID=1048205 RepID=UPI00379AB5DB
MAEGYSDQGTDNAVTSDNFMDERAVVELTYRPRPSDHRVGLRVRERIKRTGILLRGGLVLLCVGLWVLSSVGRGSINVGSAVPVLIVVLLVWSRTWVQAAHVQRIVGWQGEYRTTVSPDGITCRTDHSTLIQKWSIFRGYRETEGHFVLLSRDPNIMILDVLAKRDIRETGDLERLRAILDLRIPRM